MFHDTITWTTIHYVIGAASRHFRDDLHHKQQNDKSDKRLTRWRFSFADTGIPVSCLYIKQLTQQNK